MSASEIKIIVTVDASDLFWHMAMREVLLTLLDDINQVRGQLGLRPVTILPSPTTYYCESHMTRLVSPQLWALCDPEGSVYWTSGGSSTSPKLMIYDTQASAEKARRWAPPDAEVWCIYNADILPLLRKAAEDHANRVMAP